MFDGDIRLFDNYKQNITLFQQFFAKTRLLRVIAEYTLKFGT